MGNEGKKIGNTWTYAFIGGVVGAVLGILAYVNNW